LSTLLDAVRLIHPSWLDALNQEIGSTWFKELAHFVDAERQQHSVFPAETNVFKVFHTPIDSIRVVILGQDPYHDDNQAHGLSFSVLDGVTPPPSLRNIFKELESDVGVKKPKSGNLEPWANQGVMLLNTVLTVRAHSPNSHRKKGWEKFTDQVIRILGSQAKPMIFVLWGKPAQDKKKLIDIQQGHIVIESPHPSPLSANSGFFGSKPFSKVNQALESLGEKPIEWTL
jgi:uracil-DNA glycosylase